MHPGTTRHGRARSSARAAGPLDAVVVGAGFGGLGAALRLAERGARVALFERLHYPGGCACTFEHQGHRFEGGATLFAGFEEGQLFRRWIDEHSLSVEVDHLESPIELRTAEHTIRSRRDRRRHLEEFERIPGAPVDGLRAFFDLQERVARVLWEVLDDAELLPPLDLRRVMRHAQRLPRYAPLARLVGRPLWRVLERLGLTEFRPLVHWLDAQCQITVQCGVREAEAPFALAALDHVHRGAAHVRGGIGRLAEELADAIARNGGSVHFGANVKRARFEAGQWIVETAKENHRAPHLVCNLIPADVERLIGTSTPSLRRLDERATGGWSACALFRTVRAPDSSPQHPLHLELVDDPTLPFTEGNHVFASIGAADEGGLAPGLRRMTVSTHVRPSTDSDDERTRIEAVQDAMRRTLETRAPEWTRIIEEFTASPRTYRRWTGRSGGLVGGIPRRAGFAQYGDVLRPRLPRGLHLVGDSVFPGQSILAVASGGVRVADSIAARRLSRERRIARRGSGGARDGRRLREGRRSVASEG